MTEIAPKKRFWTRLVLVAALPLAVALYIAVPFTLIHLGLAREYGWSFLRCGHKEISQSIAGFHNWRKPILSGPVFVTRGDKLHISYHISPAEDSVGKFWLRVSPLFGNQTLWHRTFEMKNEGAADVPLDGRHFYMIGMAYKNYTGRAEIDWAVR